MLARYNKPNLPTNKLLHISPQSINIHQSSIPLYYFPILTPHHSSTQLKFYNSYSINKYDKYI